MDLCPVVSMMADWWEGTGHRSNGEAQIKRYSVDHYTGPLGISPSVDGETGQWPLRYSSVIAMANSRWLW